MSAQDVRLFCGDAFDLLASLADSSVGLIVTDPPFNIGKAGWDKWPTAEAFIDWIGRLCGEFRRVLKPNGSLYLFASPRFAARVECKAAESFNVLNCIRWEKSFDNADRRHVAQIVDKGLARSYYPGGERVIFAEHYGADNMAKGEAGYAAKCDQLRGFVFEPIRAYLDAERTAAGLTPEQVNVLCGYREQGGMAGRHYFSRSQFHPPTAPAYAKLQTTGRFERSYTAVRAQYEDLRAQYEDLRAQYEDLRRPFAVTAADPYTDVWDFPTVPHRPGKHSCEKPAAMAAHIVKASSRPGDTVADFFMGSGVFGEAAVRLGRHFVGSEKDPTWHAKAAARIEAARPERLLIPSPA